MASFARANLTLANLLEVGAEGALFDEADLYRVYAMCADFRDASFRRANLRKIALTRAVCERARFDEADLSESDLDGCVLRFANFTDAILTSSSRIDADLQDAILYCTKGLVNEVK